MKKLIAGFAILASVAPTSFALASETTTRPQPTAETLVAMCTERVANIPTFLTDLETRRNKNSEKMQSNIDRITAFITKAQDAGSDTSALEANLETLASYQSNLEADYHALVAQLTSTQTFECSEDTVEEWKANRETTKSYFDTMKANVTDIKELRQEIKANMKTIIENMKASETETE